MLRKTVLQGRRKQRNNQWKDQCDGISKVILESTTDNSEREESDVRG